MAFCFSSSAAFRGSGAENIADTTANPHIPPPYNSDILSSVIPPIAAAGSDVEEHISARFSFVIRSAFFLVGDGNTAPTPR